MAKRKPKAAASAAVAKPAPSPLIIWRNIGKPEFKHLWDTDQTFYISTTSPHPNQDQNPVLRIRPSALKREFAQMLAKISARERGFLAGRYYDTLRTWMPRQYRRRKAEMGVAATNFYTAIE